MTSYYVPTVLMQSRSASGSLRKSSRQSESMVHTCPTSQTSPTPQQQQLKAAIFGKKKKKTSQIQLKYCFKCAKSIVYFAVICGYFKFFCDFFLQNRAFTTNKLCRKCEKYFSHIMLIVSKLNLVDTQKSRIFASKNKQRKE